MDKLPCLWETSTAQCEIGVSQVTWDKTPQTVFQRYAVMNDCADINIIGVHPVPVENSYVFQCVQGVWIRMQSTHVFEFAQHYYF